MIIGETREHRCYTRNRKGKREVCHTTRKLYHLRCDSCGGEFSRHSKQFNINSAAHVCSNCDQKQFAQKQSSILRQYNKYDASNDKFKL